MPLHDNSEYKTLLVCSQSCERIYEHLMAVGCVVVVADNGEVAVSLALRHSFDTAIVVSTGKEMDMAETVFNLKDIRTSMQIIILAESDKPNDARVAREFIAHPVANVKVLTREGFGQFLEALKSA